MPIFGRYLLKNYLKVLILAVLSFIAILLVSRLEDIAEFATMGAPLSYVVLFTLYQIPYVLPISIPISCVISALILFQRLSHTGELTALRAGGISIRKIVTPLLIAALFLSIGTFYIASEIATTCHMATRRMVHDITSVNPLLLLQCSKIAKLKGSYIQMNPIRNGEAAKNLVIAMKNPSTRDLNLFLARDVAMEKDVLVASSVSSICPLSSKTEETPSLAIENQKTLSSSAPEFSFLLRQKGWKISTDHLKLAYLRLDMEESIGFLKYNPYITSLRNRLMKCYVEIVRRIGMGLAAFTFTFMGVAFGLETSRNHRKRGILIVSALAALTLIAFFVGKELDHMFWIATSLFLVPHILIIGISLITLKRIQRGLE